MKIDRRHFPPLSAEELRPEYFPFEKADPALRQELRLWVFVPKEARKLSAEYREAQMLNADLLAMLAKELNTR